MAATLNAFLNLDNEYTPMIKKNTDDPVATEQNGELSQREKRSLVFHLLYAAESYDYQEELPFLVNNLNKFFEYNLALEDDIVQAASAIIEHREKLDHLYKPLLTNWRFERIGICTKLILRYALWEMYYTTTASTIIINEAIELAKSYAEHDAYKFINGILDEIVKSKTIAP